MLLPTKLYPLIEPQILFRSTQPTTKENNDAVVPLNLTSDSPSLISAFVVRNENTSIACLLVFVT